MKAFSEFERSRDQRRACDPKGGRTGVEESRSEDESCLDGDSSLAERKRSERMAKVLKRGVPNEVRKTADLRQLD